MGKFVDLTGKKFGRWTVISYKGHSRWWCVCECGTERDENGFYLTHGITKSCGCLKRELTIERSIRHGLCHTRLYECWGGMQSRCYNSKKAYYKNYGGRGIKVCDEWLGENGFINFYNWAMANGYRDDLSIDRINVNGNYEPSNCRWATRTQQANNTRSNRFIEYNGEVHTIKEWSCLSGINYQTLISRINRGCTTEEAFFGAKWSARRNENNFFENIFTR